MTHLLRHNPHPCQPFLRSRRRPYRKPFLITLALVGLALASVSCSEAPSEPPPVPVTNTEPVGEGLKIIGYSMLAAAVVGVLGRMLK